MNLLKIDQTKDRREPLATVAFIISSLMKLDTSSRERLQGNLIMFRHSTRRDSIHKLLSFVPTRKINRRWIWVKHTTMML